MELLLVAFALFAIATPFATVYLLWRQNKIRQQLLKLTDLSVEITDGLRRDLLELKRQVEASATARASDASTPAPVHAAVHTQADRASAPVAPPVHENAEPAVISSAGVISPSPAVEKLAEFIAARQKQDAASQRLAKAK